MISLVENDCAEKWLMIKITFIIILTFSLHFPLSLLLNDGLGVETLTPPGYMYHKRADFAPKTLIVDTITNTHVSNDPFLMD
jgi:hypothetical protein